jgi:septum formation protein
MITDLPIVLASQSPRRVELLRQLVPDFAIVSSFATELEDISQGPRRLCELNAQRKAIAVAERHPHHLVLGADTLVFLDGQLMGKPVDLEMAREFLNRLSGRAHEVVTGVCIVQLSTNRMRLFSEVTHVKFHALTAADIDEYLARVPVLDKAGGYAIQEEGHRLVERIEGSLSNVIGLPVEALRRAFQQWLESYPDV